MKTILIAGKENNSFIEKLSSLLTHENFIIERVDHKDKILSLIKNNVRTALAIFENDFFTQEIIDEIIKINDKLPLMLLKTDDQENNLHFNEICEHALFIDCSLYPIEDVVNRIKRSIEDYINAMLPPLTQALFKYVNESKYTFCTPGHMGGTAYNKSPVGSIFLDFYGENTLKSDISVSVAELGSLLDHSGPHKEAEKYIAETFNADRSYIVTNGTSTANKIVGIYAVPAGSTILIDRNCHKSITHLLMMNNITPIYLKPTRNAYGILGGIPAEEFTKESILDKITNTLNATWPVHAVITNSTYDGLFYNTDYIKNTLSVKSIHFDSAWVPYTNFHPIYNGKTGMGGKAVPNKVIYETQSTHKLLAAFSQASMIHVKGTISEDTFNEAYMMHTSTSPLYSIVASTEMAAAMMKGNAGKHLIRDSIDRAIKFRREIKQIRTNTKNWFFDIWQPDNIDNIECWELKKGESWHGFKDIDPNHMYLDPIKITLLTPGLNKQGELEDTGIPASIVSKFLDDKGIIVEKTGPYNILVLFSIGVDDTKAMSLMRALNEFKELYDANALVKDVLPSVYATSPIFYKNKRIQELAQEIHQLTCHHNLPQLMFSAFEVLPTMIMTPYSAFQLELKGEIEECYLEDIIGKVSANMILPYPPGVPLVMPGEMITEESRPILEFLMMLCEIGAHYPGFETDIHGAYEQEDGRYTVKVLKHQKGKN